MTYVRCVQKGLAKDVPLLLKIIAVMRDGKPRSTKKIGMSIGTSTTLVGKYLTMLRRFGLVEQSEEQPNYYLYRFTNKWSRIDDMVKVTYND